MSSDITKIMQEFTTAQENTGNLTKNAISQALTRPQEVIPPNPTIESRTFETNFTLSSSNETNWTFSWQTNNFCLPQHSNNDIYHSHIPFERPMSPHDYVNQQPPNPTPFDFNQSIVKLFRH